LKGAHGTESWEEEDAAMEDSGSESGKREAEGCKAGQQSNKGKRIAR